MTELSKFEYAKQVIRNGIRENISFDELRELLPEWRKRPLQAIIFDVMEELNMKNVPFPGMLVRPRLSRAPIQIDEKGNIWVAPLLVEKGFTAENCAVYAHIGPNKITLTIKPKQK